MGGSKIAALVDGADHRRLGWAQVATDVSSPEATLDCIAAAVEEALADAPATLADVAAIGIGIPGRVQPDSGLVETAVNLHWRQLRAGPLLAARFGVPCQLANDARAAALGAYQVGDEQRFQNWAYISVGTGIAGGLILRGQLWRGPNGMAGEIGHVIVRPDGPLCACGLNGCLEAMAAGPAITRQAQALLRARPAIPGHGQSLLDAPGPLTTARVYQAARYGDALASSVTHQAGRYLAQAVHSLVMTCDVERVVFGGGVAAAGSAFIDPISGEIERLRQASPLAAEALRPGLIGLGPLGHEAGLWGALALAERGLAERGLTEHKG